MNLGREELDFSPQYGLLVDSSPSDGCCCCSVKVSCGLYSFSTLSVSVGGSGRRKPMIVSPWTGGSTRPRQTRAERERERERASEKSTRKPPVENRPKGASETRLQRLHEGMMGSPVQRTAASFARVTARFFSSTLTGSQAPYCASSPSSFSSSLRASARRDRESVLSACVPSEFRQRCCNRSIVTLSGRAAFSASIAARSSSTCVRRGTYTIPEAPKEPGSAWSTNGLIIYC